MDLDPKNIFSINVLKGPAAVNKYGDKGQNGVIEVLTLKKLEFKGTGDDLQFLAPSDNNSTDPNTQERNPSTITVTGYKTSDTINNSDPNTSEKAPSTITIEGFKASDPNPKPLIILDGVEKEADFDINTISADNFESIRVLKDGEATQQFGEKGENGVIDISTKKSGWTVSYGRNVMDLDELYNIDLFKQNGLENAVIFVDGVNMGNNYVPTMKYSEVESIGTYPPGKFTTDRYGRQGKNGVIEITTKKK